jgi:hypothetical protein
MKSIVPSIVLALVFSGGLVSSSAWSQTVRIGPGGVRISPEREYREERRDRRWERRDRCRTVIERRRNRFGEVVTRRTRVCR